MTNVLSKSIKTEKNTNKFWIRAVPVTRSEVRQAQLFIRVLVAEEIVLFQSDVLIRELQNLLRITRHRLRHEIRSKEYVMHFASVVDELEISYGNEEIFYFSSSKLCLKLNDESRKHKRDIVRS